jgi:hypothetical protein
MEGCSRIAATIALIALFGGRLEAQQPTTPFPPDVPPLLPEAAALDPLHVCVYNVADLVMELQVEEESSRATLIEASPNSVHAAAVIASPRERALENLAELSMIVQSVVAPDSWEMSGGPGRISVHGQTASFIVRQSHAVHEELADLLSQLRAGTDVEVEFECRTLSPRSGRESDFLQAAAAGGPLAPLERGAPYDVAASAVAALGDVCEVGKTERVTIVNGRSARLGGLVTAVVSADRRTVRLQLASPAATADAPPQRFYCRMADHQTMMLPSSVTGADAARVLISVRILCYDEEESPAGEETLELPESPAAVAEQPAPEASPR